MEGRFILEFFSALIISDFMQIEKLLTVSLVQANLGYSKDLIGLI